jgi:hypothetical protein
MIQFGNNKKYEGYCYVMISTENQLVNYIPLSEFYFEENNWFLLTRKDDQNQDFDKCLEKLLGRAIPNKNIIKLQYYQFTSIQVELENILNDKEKIFWNVTGGQRPQIIAINNFIHENKRENDIICYFEGNTGEMYLQKGNGEEKLNPIKVDLNKKNITIKHALNSRGFDYYGKTSPMEPSKNELDYFDHLFSLYKDAKNGKKIRDDFRKLNITKDEDVPILVKAIETNNNIKEFETYSEKLKLEKEKPDQKYRRYIFGYLFEDMVFSYIVKKYSNCFSQISHSVKIDFLDKKVYKDNKNLSHKCLDEMDIMLLTKKGTQIILELKSGSTSGDTMKGHHYSTYATSGVYGMPILVSPLMKSEYDNYNKSSDLDKFIETVNYALRAGITVWYVDTIDTELVNLLNGVNKSA